MFSRQEPGNPLTTQIDQVFYNGLLERFMDIDGVTADNLEQKMLIQTQNMIIATLYISANNATSDSIILHNGLEIQERNCPNSYLAFFQATKRLSSIYNQHFPDQCAAIDSLPVSLAEEIEFLAILLMSMDGFDKIKAFILESKGIISSSNSNITTDLIQQTFYNQMLNQTLAAIDTSLISIDDLKYQEPCIYMALPALTLLETIEKSKNCSGIQLLENKIVNEQNCPPEHNVTQLLALLLECKVATQQANTKHTLSSEEMELVKQLCVGKETTQLPKDIPNHVGQFAAIVNGMSSQISQTQLFRDMFPKVRTFCLETLESEISELRFS